MMHLARTQRATGQLAVNWPSNGHQLTNDARAGRGDSGVPLLHKGTYSLARDRSPPGAALQPFGEGTAESPGRTHCPSTASCEPIIGTPGSPERLAGIAHGASADPDALLRQLHEAVRTAASVIRQLSTTERGKRGISTERGEMTVAQVIESFIVDHAEEHLVQVQGALRR